MSATYRVEIQYSRLLSDLWGILQGKRYPVFPRGSRAAPSPVVYVFPDFNVQSGYRWNFWEEISAPVLISMNKIVPPYLGGWGNPESKPILDAYLRAALEASSWSVKVDYTVLYWI